MATGTVAAPDPSSYVVLNRAKIPAPCAPVVIDDTPTGDAGPFIERPIPAEALAAWNITVNAKRYIVFASTGNDRPVLT